MDEIENPRLRTGGEGEGHEDCHETTTPWHKLQEQFDSFTPPFQIELNDTNRSKRRKWKWTPRMEAQAQDILTVLERIPKRDKPTRVRGIYYKLISTNLVHGDHWKWADKHIDIDDAVSRNLKQLRIAGRVDADDIIDEHRILTDKVGFTDPTHFVDYRLRQLGRGYKRCNAQQQARHIEVWIEKNTLLHIVEPVADEFCRQVVVCRGYLSFSFQTEFYMRAEEAKARGQIPTILYFGDWDPSGVNMLYAIIQTMQDELELDGVEYYRCGINPKHFSEIPAAPVPVKAKDPRAKAFIRQHGTTAYELDAFEPDRLRELVRENIAAFTDMESYEANNEQSALDGERVEKWAEDVRRMALGYADAYGI